jgi:hypothetical protein
MFDSLTDQIRQDEGASANKGEMFIRYAVVLVVAVLVCGGLYVVVQYM